jgi:hypothetical protein
MPRPFVTSHGADDAVSAQVRGGSGSGAEGGAGGGVEDVHAARAQAEDIALAHATGGLDTQRDGGAGELGVDLQLGAEQLDQAGVEGRGRRSSVTWREGQVVRAHAER